MADAVIVTSAMLAGLTLAGGYAGVSFNDADLPNLGKLFYEYTQKIDMTWDAVTATFHAGLAFDKVKQELAMDSNLANLLRGFFDDAIPDSLTAGSYMNMNYCGIPVLIDDSFVINELIPNQTPYGVRCDIPLGAGLTVEGTTFPVGSARMEWVYTDNTAVMSATYKLMGGLITHKGGRKYSHHADAEGMISHNWFYITYDRYDGYYLNSCSYTEKPETGEGIETLAHYCATTYGSGYADQLSIPDLFPVPVNGTYDGDALGEQDTPLAIPNTLPNVNVKVEDGVVTLPDTMTDNPSITIDRDVVIDEPEVIPETPTIPEIPIIPPIIPDVPDVPEIDEGEDGNIDEDITDNWSNSHSGGLYYYYIGTDVADSSIDDVIGHATGVVSLSYTPYLWYKDLNITKLPYDSERFNNVSTFTNFYVYRINEVTRPVKKVGGFTAYDDNFSVNIGEGCPYSYKNETKLYQYPYSFAYVYDGINQPMEVKYHYLAHVYNDIYIKQTVSDKCTYGIFISDYKGDAEGNLESVVLTSGNELPCSSSTYAQWFATNRNQINQNVQNVLANNAIQSHGAKQQFEIQKDMSTMNVIGGLGTALAGLFTMNIGGVGTGLMNALNTTNMLKSQQATLNTQLALNKQSDQNAIQSAMALNNDMRNAPPTLISHGSNVFYGILNTDRKLLLVRMGLSEVDMYRIGTYFTMYGYKQNKIMDINLRSRKYFNYFKITAPNIVSYSVPHSQLESIKEIFKNGITLWHYNNSDKVLDYFHSDNYEV